MENKKEMQKQQVFITRRIAEKALALLENEVEMEIWEEETPPPYEILQEKIKNCDGLLTLLTDPIDADLIKSASNLKTISQMAVGFDNIDINTATELGIPVGNTPDALTETCADFTFALILSIARRIVESDKEVRQGIWRPWGPDVLVGEDVFNATLGIIGLGRIGQAVARRASGFNMKILYTGRSRHPEAEKELGATYVDLDTLLQESDFISIHTSLNDETRGMIGEKEFSKMKKNAILINTSRGGVIDSQALYTALKEKRITGAALDVYETEPIPDNTPILELDNLVITPHIASASVKTREKIAIMAAENLLAGLKGKTLPYCANPKVYKRS